MPGTKSNVRRFNQIDVFIAHTDPLLEDVEPLIPAHYSEDLGADFERAGLLAPDGFTQARDESNTNINAYGIDGIVDSIDTFNFESWNAIFLEDNTTVRSLLYPGSTTPTTRGSGVPTPVYERLVTVFDLRNTATGYGERWITVGGSVWRVNGDRAVPDSDIRRTPLIATVFASDALAIDGIDLDDGGLYVVQRSTDPEPTP